MMYEQFVIAIRCWRAFFFFRSIWNCFARWNANAALNRFSTENEMFHIASFHPTQQLLGVIAIFFHQAWNFRNEWRHFNRGSLIFSIIIIWIGRFARMSSFEVSLFHFICHISWLCWWPIFLTVDTVTTLNCALIESSYSWKHLN